MMSTFIMCTKQGMGDFFSPYLIISVQTKKKLTKIIIA